MDAGGRVDVMIAPVTELLSTGVTFEAVMAVLRDRDAQMYVEEGDVLHYAGPPLDADDPVRFALSEHHERLVEVFTLRPQGRCVIAGCDHPRAVGDRRARHLDTIHEEQAVWSADPT